MSDSGYDRDSCVVSLVSPRVAMTTKYNQQEIHTQKIQNPSKTNPIANKLALGKKKMQYTQKIKRKATVICKNCSCVHSEV